LFLPTFWLLLPNPRKCKISLRCAAEKCPGEVYL
jgi:hypothetical protein